MAEMVRFFGLYPSWAEGPKAFWILILVSFLIGCTARFPVSRVRYKIPKKDYEFDVRIADLFALPYDLVISTNSTFDTDVKGGIIAKDSLQGQFLERVFEGDVQELNKQIERSLASREFEKIDGIGKKKRYPLGTVAVIKRENKVFYMLAMSHLNAEGNARTTPRELETALDGLWREISERGELGDIAVPVIGTGKGRVQSPRQKIIEHIAQSFADASKNHKVANKLVIVVSPADAEKYDINLFQIRDYLTLSLTS
jgi:hypothetical protein